MARPSAGDGLAHQHSQSLIFIWLLAGFLGAILVLKAGVSFVSPVLPSAQAAAKNTFVGDRPVSRASATPQAKPASKGATASHEQASIRVDHGADALANNLPADRREIARTALASRSAQPGEEIATQLRQALEAEREQVAALARELAAARRELETQTAKATSAAASAATERERQKAVQQLEEERKRVSSVSEELAAARRELETQTAKATAATAAAATEKERQGAALLRQSLLRVSQELAAARRELEGRATKATAAAAATATEGERQGSVRQALEEERKRVTALTQELAVVRRQFEEHTASVTTAAVAAAMPLQEALERERQKAVQQLEEERKRVASVSQDLAAARRELETLTAKANAAAAAAATEKERQGAVQQALEEERKRVTSVTRELAAARLKLEARTVNPTAVTEVAVMPSQGALVRERQTADVSSGELAPAGHAIEVTAAFVNPPELRTPQVEPSATPAHPAKDTIAIDGPVLARAEVGVEAKKLLARADLFLRQGNISAARVVLERAAAMGSAEASYRLAETYDPIVLSSWGALGTRGDSAKARELYARAYANGIQQAKDRVNALQ